MIVCACGCTVDGRTMGRTLNSVTFWRRLAAWQTRGWGRPGGFAVCHTHCYTAQQHLPHTLLYRLAAPATHTLNTPELLPHRSARRPPNIKCLPPQVPAHREYCNRCFRKRNIKNFALPRISGSQTPKKAEYAIAICENRSI